MSHPRLCAAHNCMQAVSPGQLMCKPHWWSVPKPLRDEVWASWRAYQRIDFKVMSPERRGALTDRYREAVKAAVAHSFHHPLSPALVRETTARTREGGTVNYDQGRLF